jgi:hypothetical protein
MPLCYDADCPNPTFLAELLGTKEAALRGPELVCPDCLQVCPRCRECNGNGIVSGGAAEACGTCGGDGIEHLNLYQLGNGPACPACDGIGRPCHDGKVGPICAACHGTGLGATDAEGVAA